MTSDKYHDTVGQCAIVCLARCLMEQIILKRIITFLFVKWVRLKETTVIPQLLFSTTHRRLGLCILLCLRGDVNS